MFAIGTDGVENINLLGDTGDDEVRFSGNTVQGTRLDAGEGNDVIIVGYNGIVTSFQHR